MRTIHKFPLSLGDAPSESVLLLPRYCQPLYVANDPKGVLCTWVILNDEAAKKTKYTFFIFGTGMPLPHIPLQSLGMQIDGPYVWHFFFCRNDDMLMPG